MRVLLLNLKLDEDDTTLGFTTAWTNAIARRVEHVVVVTMETGRIAVADNVEVRSLGKERDWSEPRRALAFYRHLLAVSGRVDVCFAHMAELFAAMASPVLKARRVPTVLWYAHGAVPRKLRVADRLVDRAVTSTPGGYRLPSRKLRVLHQGIDTARFHPPAEPEGEWGRTVVSVGRFSAVKRVREMVEALPEGARLLVAGTPITASDRAYEADVRALIAARGADVELLGAVPFRRVAETYRRGAVFLNLGESGSLDKAILEAMASGCIAVSTNDAFRRAVAEPRDLNWLAPPDDPAAVTAALSRALGEPATSALRTRLRVIVEAEHGLDALADKIVAELEAVRRRR